MKRNILLNPGPVTTTDTVKNALLVPDICHRESEFTTLLQKIRSKLLKVIQAGDDYTSILFCASGTGALEACLSSLPGTHDKIAIINNGSYGQRLIDIAKRFNIQVVEINFPVDKPLEIEKIKEKLTADPLIRYVAIVHHETSTGLLNPLREIGELCHTLNRKLIVDAMSSFGGCEIDAKLSHIDCIVSSANKCLHGMPGLSFAIIKKDLLAQTKGHARSYYFDLHKQFDCLEKSGQLAFTPPVQVAYAFHQALNEFFQEGIKARIERFKTNYFHLVNGLEALGFSTVIEKSAQSHILVLVKFPDDDCDYDFDNLHDYLYQKGYTIYPRKLAFDNTFRLSCIGDLHPKDIEAFLVELKIYLIALRQPNIA